MISLHLITKHLLTSHFMGKSLAPYHHPLLIPSLTALVTFGVIQALETPFSSVSELRVAHAQSDDCHREYSAGAARKDKIVLDIPLKDYLARRTEVRDWSSQYDLNRFVNADHEIVQNIAALLQGFDLSDGEEFSVSTRGKKIPDYQRVFEFVATNITYTADVDRGYTKYPIETLVERAGDCEDKAVLGAALLRCMGRKVVWIYEPRHVTLGIGLHENEGLPSVFTSGPPLRRIKPATFELEGSRYFAVEITAPYWHKFKEQIIPEPGRGIVPVK